MSEEKVTIIRIKGPYRILNYTLDSRPIFVAHSQFKKLMTAAGGRLPLAGAPNPIDLLLEVKLDVRLHWREKEALEKVSDLVNFPIKGLAPGIVYVNETKSNFMFYGNSWFHLDPSVRNSAEPTEEEEGQQRFMASIDKMEQGSISKDRFVNIPTITYKQKRVIRNDIPNDL